MNTGFPHKDFNKAFQQGTFKRPCRLYGPYFSIALDFYL